MLRSIQCYSAKPYRFEPYCKHYFRNNSGFSISCQNATDGIIQLSATGGTGGEYSYSIDGGLTFPYSSSLIQEISNLEEGTYSVVAIDSNLCESLPQNLVLSAPTPLSFDFITTSLQISCNGFNDGEVNVQAIDGVGGYLYSIDSGTTTQATGVFFSNLSANTYEFTVIDDNNCSYSELYDLNQPQAVNIVSALVSSDYNGSQVTCFGASDAILSVNALGGTPHITIASSTTLPFTRCQSTILLPICLQAYKLYNLLMIMVVYLQQPFEVIQPNELSISNVDLVSNVSCFGGSDGEAIITASGGTGAYSYFVDALYNSVNQAPYLITGLAANTYNVVVSDVNNCTSSAAVLPITQPNQLNTNVSFINLGCDGDFGSATVNPSGGTPNYNIDWSNGASTTSIEQLVSGACILLQYLMR